YDWKTSPRLRRWTASPVMSSPPRTTRPPSGSTRPATMRSSVRLPQPGGARSDTNSPGAAASDTASTATTTPNDLRSRRTESAGVVPLTGAGALACTPRSARDLAPPALRPFRKLLRHEIGIGEVHVLDERTIGHERRERRR